jgi:hypothetical protein
MTEYAEVELTDVVVIPADVVVALVLVDGWDDEVYVQVEVEIGWELVVVVEVE